jgi:LPXTG-site transpeptidase (sortase) family protein
MGTYHFLGGANKKTGKKRKLWIVLPMIGVLGGLYLLVNVLWPNLPPTALAGNSTTSQRLVSDEPGKSGNRLYVPQLNVDVAITQGDASALEQGAWWRKPENGNPKAGGNFVLSAHRFQLGVTPQETRAKSPFYHIDLLQVGDEIFVDYEGTRYVYKVVNKDQVPTDIAEIEQHTDRPQLTLYSSNQSGEVDGWEVIYAEPIGTVAWSDTPQIVPLQ